MLDHQRGARVACKGRFVADQKIPVQRAQYFHPEEGDEPNLLEKAIRYANNAAANENANQQSLFGGSTTVTLAEPAIPACEHWGLMKKLHKEKEVVGMYLSGHPLDDYKIEFKNFIDNIINQYKKLNNDKYIYKYNQIQHQYKGSECGVFSIYFIIRCLKNYDINDIFQNKMNIRDDEVNKIRDLIFIFKDKNIDYFKYYDLL